MFPVNIHRECRDENTIRKVQQHLRVGLLAYTTKSVSQNIYVYQVIRRYYTL